MKNKKKQYLLKGCQVAEKPIMLVPCNSKGMCHEDEQGRGYENLYYRVRDERMLAQLILMGARPWDRWDVEPGPWGNVKEFLSATGFDPDTRCYKLERDRFNEVLARGDIERMP